MNRIQWRVVVKGRVQGVGFRWSVVELAQTLDLKGEVANLKNGDVEIVVQGEKDRLEIFLKDLSTYCSTAKVESVQKFEQKVETLYSDFTIKY